MGVDVGVHLPWLQTSIHSCTWELLLVPTLFPPVALPPSTCTCVLSVADCGLCQLTVCALWLQQKQWWEDGLLQSLLQQHGQQRPQNLPPGWLEGTVCVRWYLKTCLLDDLKVRSVLDGLWHYFAEGMLCFKWFLALLFWKYVPC